MMGGVATIFGRILFDVAIIEIAENDLVGRSVPENDLGREEVPEILEVLTSREAAIPHKLAFDKFTFELGHAIS
ncbi:hypothetical protein Tco_1106137 [Tanacetum coccineum]